MQSEKSLRYPNLRKGLLSKYKHYSLISKLIQNIFYNLYSHDYTYTRPTYNVQRALVTKLYASILWANTYHRTYRLLLPLNNLHLSSASQISLQSLQNTFTKQSTSIFCQHTEIQRNSGYISLIRYFENAGT